MRFDRHDPLHQSIIKTVGVYGVLELLSFTLLNVFFSFGLPFRIAYLITQIAYHLLVMGLLIAGGNFFRIVGSSKRLDRVNAANKVTLIRISMLPSLLFLILAFKQHPIGAILIIVIALTFLTDLVDGRISRAGNQVTAMGKILDSVGDYSLLLVVAFAYRIYDLLPDWLFYIIMFRLLFQAVGMLALLIAHKRVEPRPTVFGKIAVATIMILFAMEPLKLLIPVLPRHVKTVELAAGCIVLASVLDKGWYFFGSRRLRQQP